MNVKWLRPLQVWAVAAMVTGGALSADAVTLRWANTGDAVSMDPYYFNETFTLGFTGNIYDGLVARGKDLKIGPALAVSWTILDPNTWEFKLRKGVKFHEGQEFTSADVVFSYHRAISAGSDIKANFVSIASIEAKDPYTVIIKTKQPDPILLADLSFWWILSKEWCEKNGAMEVADIHHAGVNYATTHANGTGAYMLVSREADVKTVLKKNPDWWGWKSGFGNSNVDQIVFTPIKESGTRVAALLSGSVDMLYEVPIQDLGRIKAAGGKVFQTAETRTVFLGMDQFRDELIDSSVKGKNPLKDRRVRLALYKAIDEDLIVKQIMKGAAVPATSFVTKEMAGYDPNFKRFAYAPDESKKLLAEAGYPKGLRIALHGPNDRYVNDARIIQAVGQMWTRIGVQTEVDPLPWSSFVGQANKQAFSAFLFGWGTGTAEASDPLIAQNATFNPAKGWGAANRGRYSNPALDRLIDQALTTTDDAARETVLQQAQRVAFDDVQLFRCISKRTSGRRVPA